MPRPLRRVFVTATDTLVGKTHAACALLALLAREGLSPACYKPYESGCADLDAPEDALALRAAARSQDPLGVICPHRFVEPVAPGVAARRVGLVPSWKLTLQLFERFGKRPLVVEGAGGLRVPLDDAHDVVDSISALGLPVLLVARAGLGTLNHTALSLEALARRGVEVSAVLLTHSLPPDASSADNAQWLEERCQVRVLGPVPHLTDAAARRRAFERALRPLVSPGPSRPARRAVRPRR